MVITQKMQIQNPMKISLEHQPDKTFQVIRTIEESIPYARELNASETDEVQVVELSSNVKKYSLKGSKNSLPRNEEIKIPNIYE